ncbi:MAG: hypothetical protein ACKVW3_07785 [Phycisphaerales bacterium]
MSLKPKTVRRLLLVGAVAVLLIGSVFALFVVRHWQAGRLTERHRQQGLAAVQRQDWVTGLSECGSYLNRTRGKQRDPEVLLAYADARLNIQEPTGKHTIEAIPFLRQYLEAKPEDRETALRLLKLYMDAGYFPEARDASSRLRPIDLRDATKKDIEVLEIEAMALLGAKDASDRLKQVLARLADLDPLNVPAGLVRIDMMNQAGSTTEARTYADKLLADHPGAPPALLLAGLARRARPTVEGLLEAGRLLGEAAGLDATGKRVRPPAYSDVQFARRLVAAMDAVGAGDFALEVLRDGAERWKEIDFRRLYVRRLWQDGRIGDVAEATTDVSVDDPKADAELLGLRGMALMSTGQREAGLKIAGELAKRRGDFRAASWAVVLPLADPQTGVKASDAAETLKKAAKENPFEPLIPMLRGEALASMGLKDEARASWATVTQVPSAAGWVVPRMRIAESLLADDRAAEAADMATEALFMAPNRLAVNVLWLQAQAARMIKSPDGGFPPAEILKRLDVVEPEIDPSNPDPNFKRMRHSLVPVRVLLLSRTGKPDEAKSLAMAALEAADPLDEDTIRRLAAVSRSERLGLEDIALKKAEEVYGKTATIEYTRACQLADAGRPEEGLVQIRNAVAAKPGDSSMRLAEARYLERIGHRDAGSAWRALGEAFPDDLFVQRTVLESVAATEDRAFIDRTAARYQKAQGQEQPTEDATIRLAKSRALIRKGTTKADRDRAVAMLAALVGEQPNMVEPKLTLASALSMSDAGKDIRPDYPRAITQLTDALNLEPRSPVISLELARVYQLTGNLGAAREALVRVASDKTLDIGSRQVASGMLLSQGDPMPVAVPTLAEIVEQVGDRAPAGLLVMLGEAYHQLRQDDKAEAMFARLVDRADDSEAIYRTASFFQKRKDEARTKASLARLDAAKLAPGEKDVVLGRLADDRGDVNEAVARFTAATEQAAGDPVPWRQLATFQLKRGEAAKALEAAEKGLAKAPGDQALTIVREQAKVLAAGSQQTDLGPLIQALQGGPMFAQGAEIIAAVRDAEAKGDLDSAAGLSRLADRFPNAIELQMVVAQRMLLFDPDRAGTLAIRAMNAAPANPAPARLAAQISLGLGRWSEMLQAATAWRDRDATRSLDPDLAVAEAHLNLRQPDRGLETLRPRLAKVTKPLDDDSLRVLNLMARLLVAGNREKDARELLTPHLADSSPMRTTVWLSIAVRDLPTFDASTAWIGQVRAAMPADAVDEQIALSTGYTVLATRYKEQQSQMLAEAKSILTRLAGLPQTGTAGAHEALGVLLHRQNELAGAEAAYRKTIELDPRRATALNNLADILDNKGELDAAAELATRAVAATEQNNAVYLETLAAIQAKRAARQAKAGDAKGAKSLATEAAEGYRRVTIARPTDVQLLGAMANASELAGEFGWAIEAYERLLKAPTLPGAYVPPVKNNLAMALLRQNRSADDRARAVELASAAANEGQEPEFFDTLGWANLAAARSDQAAQAFRQAKQRSEVKKRPLPSALIGLATALAEAGPTSRDEATALLNSIDATTLDDELKAKMAAARETIAKPAR